MDPKVFHNQAPQDDVVGKNVFFQRCESLSFSTLTLYSAYTRHEVSSSYSLTCAVVNSSMSDTAQLSTNLGVK